MDEPCCAGVPSATEANMISAQMEILCSIIQQHTAATYLQSCTFCCGGAGLMQICSLHAWVQPPCDRCHRQTSGNQDRDVSHFIIWVSFRNVKVTQLPPISNFLSSLYSNSNISYLTFMHFALWHRNSLAKERCVHALHCVPLFCC